MNNTKTSHGTPLWEVLYGMKQKQSGGQSISDGNGDKVTLSPESQAKLGDIEASEKSITYGIFRTFKK